MKKSIYIRNFLTTAGILCLSILILGVMFFFWSYQLVMRDKLASMSSTGEEVSGFISDYSVVYELDSLDMHAILTTFARTSGFDILITNPYGRVVACSDSGEASDYVGKAVPPALLAQINVRQPFVRLTDLNSVYHEPRYVFGLPLTTANHAGRIGYVFISSQTNTMIQDWRQFSGAFTLLAVVVLTLTFIISYFTTKKQTKPLKEMASAARRFARGDFSSRVDNDGRIDEIGQLTEAFNSMADALQRSEKLRRDFIANVSHELKTPMTVISGFSDGILDGTIPKEDERKYLEVISSETKRLSRLVRNMLDMTRIQPKQAQELLSESFDISEIICLSLLSFEKRIDSKKLDVATELPEDAIMTRGDKDAINQVVYNLIDNAVKFANEGSTLRVSLWKQGLRAFVCIENTGETIPEAEIPLIFDRFHKTDRSRSEDRDGVGLGLYIVKSILDNHNQDIYVTSSDGVTKFTFTLTLAAHEPR